MGRKMRKLLAIFLVLMLLSADICAIAEEVATLTLPSALQIIEEEAFYGNTSIEKVIVPDGTTEIRSRAFADSSMTELVLPDSLTFIAEDAFEGCGEFALTVPENCYAYDRCVELGLIKSEEPDPSVIESAHPYPDEFDYTWTYDVGEGTESVTITFTADTETEEDYDFIYLYTLDDVKVGAYSGTELAGQSVTIDGTGFKLRLTSDEAWGGGNTYYGFKLDSIVPKKAVPLTFDSITAESSAVNAGEIIRWTVATTGGKAPVYYDYTVLLGEEKVATGTMEAPNVIEYTPVRAGEYKLSVIVRDSGTAVLPARVSEAVTVVPSTTYPESAHPYTSKMDQSWVYAAEINVESLIITFSEDTKTESNYDYIYLYDQNGAQIGKYSGTQLAAQTIEIQGSAFTIRLTSDSSTQYHGFTITNIEKYIPGPLSFVSLTVDKSKTKTGDLITWTMETEGGRRPVTYEYTVTLNGETKYTGSVTRPEQIAYVPMEAGDYIMSVVAKDAEGNALPVQTSNVRITQREVTSEEYFTYEAINGLYARITGYTGTDTGIIVPEMLGEYTVQEIGAGAFRDNATLLSIVLPNTVTKISSNAFRNCDALAGVDLGQGITSIGDYAFYDCDGMRVFAFADSVSSIGTQALRYCDQLTDVTYPKNLTTVGSYAFSDCPKFNSIEIPEGVTNIPASTFYNACSLTNIYFPESLKTIGSSAFYNCYNIDQLNFNNGLENIGEYAFYKASVSQVIIPPSVTYLSGFNYCTHLSKIEIPEGVTTIGERAFQGCISLTDAVLPDSVKTIKEYAFAACENLTSFSIPKNWTVAGKYIFQGCKNINSVVIPESATLVPANAFYEAIFIKNIEMASSVLSVGDYSFYGCDGLQEVQLSSNVTSIGQYAFAECTNLVSVDLPDELVSIGSYAFSKCSLLTDPNFPDKLESIGKNAYEYCSAIKAARLPDSVTSIGYRAFYQCTELLSINYPVNLNTIDGYGEIFKGCLKFNYVNIPEGVENIPAYVFYQADGLTEISFPSTLKRIQQCAFSYCTGLNRIVLPDEVTYVSNSVFWGCTGITEIVLPNGLKQIDSSAFGNCTNLCQVNFPQNWTVTSTAGTNGPFTGCTSLTKITVPEGVTLIPKNAFAGIEYLEEVQLPTTLTLISEGAFQNCKSLSGLDIPDSVTIIEKNAFMNCEAFQEIDFPESLEVIGIGAFRNCINLEVAMLPESVHTIGEYAFSGCVKLSEFGYPVGWETVVSDSAMEQAYRGIFSGCASLTSIAVPEGVTNLPPSALAYAPSLSEVKLPSTLKVLETCAFRGCAALKHLVLPDNLTSIGMWVFMECSALESIYVPTSVTYITPGVFASFMGNPELTIYCEYGSTALQYAIDNEISYFYLSLCDASRPIGSLYKGDGFELTGYVRSSDAILDITGRIYAADGTTVVQSVSVVPEVTDYNIGEYYNYNLKFGNLDLGSYVYEITASAGEETECLDHTSFTIVPPPQRTYFRNLNVPNGLIDVGAKFNLSGTVHSNYSISKFAVSVRSSSDSIRSQTIDVNAYSVELSQFNEQLAFETLEPGSYTFSAYLSSNGSNKKVLETNFYVGEYDEDLSEEQLIDLVTFVQTTTNKTLFDAAAGYSESAIQNMDSSDVALMVMDSSTSMFTGYVRGILQGKLTNMQVVDLYKISMPSKSAPQ